MRNFAHLSNSIEFPGASHIWKATSIMYVFVGSGPQLFISKREISYKTLMVTSICFLVLLHLCQNTCPAQNIKIVPLCRSAVKLLLCQWAEDFCLNLIQEMCCRRGNSVFLGGVHPGGQNIPWAVRIVGSGGQSPRASAGAHPSRYRGIVHSPEPRVVWCRGTGGPDDKWIFAAFVFEILAKRVDFQMLKKAVVGAIVSCLYVFLGLCPKIIQN